MAAFILSFMLILDLITFAAIESIQLDVAGWSEYWSDTWNWIDWIAYVLLGSVIALNIVNVDPLLLRKIGIIVVIFFWIKLFYWMRIFKNTAGFIRMLGEIVKDSVAFTYMLCICIGMFSNGYLLMNYTRQMNDLTPIVPESFGITPIVDSFVAAYMLGLGEF